MVYISLSTIPAGQHDVGPPHHPSNGLNYQHLSPHLLEMVIAKKYMQQLT